MVEDKDSDIQYIWSEDNPADIMSKNTSEADFASHMKRITEGELWEIMDTGRENFKNNRVTDDIITHNNTEYFSHALAKVVYGENRNEWILITISRTSK